MATLRPGRCYNRLTKKPNTRTALRVPKKSYVKGVPVSKIHQFEMGNKKGDFSIKYSLVPSVDCQVRSNCLESARISATKYLTNKFGDIGFFLKMRVFPHHVMRQNFLATGAGADRLSQGMRHAFGKPIGQAARVKKGQPIMSAAVSGKEADIKEALRRAARKLPGSCRVVKN